MDKRLYMCRYRVFTSIFACLSFVDVICTAPTPKLPSVHRVHRTNYPSRTWQATTVTMEIPTKRQQRNSPPHLNKNVINEQTAVVNNPVLVKLCDISRKVFLDTVHVTRRAHFVRMETVKAILYELQPFSVKDVKWLIR